MARRPRINLSGGVFHVLQRGNDRQAIFLTEEDRLAFLQRLARYVQELRAILHAYCLMGNHVHLLLETTEPNLSAFGQRLFGSYTQWFNRRHGRVGHVLQGRFTSRLVARDPYLLQLSRYIHLNPVKARLAARPEAYTWSSMLDYLRRRPRSPWVHTRTTLAFFGGRRREYYRYVAAGMRHDSDEPNLPRLDGLAAGDVEAVPSDTSAAGTQPAETLLRVICRHYDIPISKLRQRYTKQASIAEAKAVAAYVLRARTPLNLTQIGGVLGGISASAASQYLRKVRNAPKLTEDANQLLDTIKLQT